MKKLIYAYIDNNPPLQQTQLWFDSSIRINYDSEQKNLSVEKIQNLPSDFWSKGISDVSVIVGKNGTGKTTSLYWLLERMTTGKLTIDKLGGIIAILNVNKKEYKLFIYHDVEINNKPDKIPNTKIEIQYCNKELKDKKYEALKLTSFFCSDVFDSNFNYDGVRGELTGEINMSDRWLLVKDLENYRNVVSSRLNYHIQEYFNAHYIQNNLRICSLLLDEKFQEVFRDGIENHEIRLPRYLIFTPNVAGDLNIRTKIQELEFSRKKDPDKFFESKKLKWLKYINSVSYNPDQNNLTGSNLGRFLYASLKSFYFNLIYNFNNSNNIEYYLTDKFYEEAIGIFKKDYSNTDLAPIDWVDHIIYDRLYNFSNSDIAISHLRKFFGSLRDTLLFLNSEQIKWVNGIAYLDCYEKPGRANSNNKMRENSNSIYANRPAKINSKYKLIELMESDVFIVERFFDIRYSHKEPYMSANSELVNLTRLSAGEMSMLNLFSRIKVAYENKEGKPEIIFFDEVENRFHPEWQRRFIFYLTSFLSEIVPEKSPVQIVYTTHSPITLSDMPKECVNQLDKTDDFTVNVKPALIEETFGSNVFDLYGDSFFMTGGLIGEFAKRKIISLSKDIENKLKGNGEISNEEYEDLKKRIMMIGDSRIRQYLFSRLEQDNKNLELRRLRERVKELEEEKRKAEK